MKAKFYMEYPWIGVTKVCLPNLDCHAHNLKNLLLQDPGKRPRALKACFWPQNLLKKLFLELR